MESSSIEMASVFRRLADMLERGRSATLHLAGENILIPPTANVTCKYQVTDGLKELDLRVSWAPSTSSVHLVHQHSEAVKDTLGNVYEVFIYGEPRVDRT